MKLEIMQPWSTFVMKTKLPPEILQKMLKMTDEIVESGTDPAIARNAVGAGEMEEQFLIDFNILMSVIIGNKYELLENTLSISL